MTATTTALVLIAVMGSSTEAHAFGLPPDGCTNDNDSDTYEYHFLPPGAVGGVSLENQAIIKNAWATTWQTARSFRGGNAIDLVQWDGAGGKKFTVMVDRAADAGGRAINCTEIHLPKTTDAEVMAHVAAHELGHVLNLQHAERDSNFLGQYTWGPFPIMYCYESEAQGYGNDDESSLLYRQDRAGLTSPVLTANMGFESNASATPGMRWWSTTGGSISITTNGSRPAHLGSRYATFNNSATSQVMFQATNVLPAAGTSQTIGAATSYRPKEPASLGFLGFDFLYREVDAEPATGVGGCDWLYHPTHEPKRMTFSAWIQPIQRQHCTVAGRSNVQWSACSTPTWTIPSNRTYEGVDTMVRVFSNVTNASGALNGVDVDDVRMQT